MFRLVENNGIKYYRVDAFEGAAKHCFTTRAGGVSENEFSSMNLRFNCDDKRENVLKNFDIICSEIGVNYEDLVLSNQIHEDNVVRVTAKDKGNGIMFPNRFESADGLICGERGIPLVTFYADCVPLMFLDRVNGVIAMSHSGWKGTVKNIAQKTVDAFLDDYNSKVKDITVAIGPSIGVCCFEVGDEVADIFHDIFGDCVLEKHEKWHVNLQKAVYEELKNAGIPEENITLPGICTACNSDRLFSHRASGGKRGNLGAIMELI